jgi:mono/diheme cytochrome c family protein
MNLANWRVRAKAAALMIAAFTAVIAALSCKPATPAERGRAIYLSRCVVCHNQNPSLPGVKGPPISGSSRELVEGRVLRLQYPPGYTPKRKTHSMKAMPELARSVDDLAAFLQSAGTKQNRSNR